jgi:hypothetical protein
MSDAMRWLVSRVKNCVRSFARKEDSLGEPVDGLSLAEGVRPRKINSAVRVT